jgi:hypothetical protein
MSKLDPKIAEAFRRDERQVRVVQAVVGVIVGACGAAFVTMRCGGSGLEMLLWSLGGAVSGGVGGYHAPPWQTAIDQPGDDWRRR